MNILPKDRPEVAGSDHFLALAARAAAPSLNENLAMTHREDSPLNPEAQHAMVGVYPQNGALVASTNGAGLPVPLAVPPGYGAQHVLRGSMDANTLLHALRRRWLLAACMGTVAATATAIALWFLFPENTSATALFQVSSQPESLVFDVNQNTQKFETLQKTQLTLLRSYFVLTAAIRDPSIASLSIFADKRGEEVQWLQDYLQLDFPLQSEILSISLTGDDDPEDQRKVVDAVADAYEKEVINDNKQKRLLTRDALARSLENINKDISRKMQDLYDIAKETGIAQGGSGRDALTDLLMSELAQAQRQKSELERQMIDMRTQFLIFKQRLEDPSMIEAQVDQALAQDPTVSMMQQQLLEANYRYQQAATSVKRRSPAIAALERKIQALNNDIAQHRSRMRQQMLAQLKSSPNSTLQQATKDFQVANSSLQQQWAMADKTIKDRFEALKTRMDRSVDQETRYAELGQLQEVANDMSKKLESIDVELSAGNTTEQIQKLQPAVVTPSINKTQHYSIAIMGGLTAFALTCLGIGYMEFCNRRLNGPDQVDEGLGIRVVGTLPSVSGQSGDANSLVAKVTAAIDSVRTILMHDSTSKRRQVVLVTSAAAGEGRTTVASQLAASLARAGRRTLLVDGDLRRPRLHELFDVTLEDGLCEVLRAEVDVADVIRPTHSEGLWLLTAGYCDRDAIQALATEQMQPIFDKLRAEYDFIIVDGAPVLGISDALIFGQYSDGVILSVRRDHSQMPKIYQAAEMLRGVGIRVIGAVVNSVPTKADDRITQLQLITSKAEQQLQPS
jgi:capsular exopolysaccharide synthesis family protein